MSLFIQDDSCVMDRPLGKILESAKNGKLGTRITKLDEESDARSRATEKDMQIGKLGRPLVSQANIPDTRSITETKRSSENCYTSPNGLPPLTKSVFED